MICIFCQISPVGPIVFKWNGMKSVHNHLPQMICVLFYMKTMQTTWKPKICFRKLWKCFVRTRVKIKLNRRVVVLYIRTKLVDNDAFANRRALCKRVEYRSVFHIVIVISHVNCAQISDDSRSLHKKCENPVIAKCIFGAHHWRHSQCVRFFGLWKRVSNVVIQLLLRPYNFNGFNYFDVDCWNGIAATASTFHFHSITKKTHTTSVYCDAKAVLEFNSLF